MYGPRNQLPRDPFQKTRPSERDILDAVRQGTFFGFVECDLRVPEGLRAEMADFPPIFKKVQVDRSHVGPLMRGYCEEWGFLKRPSNLLISSFTGVKQFVFTPLLKYYLSKNLEVTKIYSCTQFAPKVVFGKLVDTVSNLRRAGDLNPDHAVRAQTAKDLGNSSVGKLQVDQTKWNRNTVTDSVGALKLIQNIHFKAVEPLDTDLFLIQQSQKAIRYDAPLYVAHSIYQLAKLNILRMVYDCIFKYIPRDMVTILYIDTDSVYAAYGGNSLEECVPVALKPAFYADYHNFFPAEMCPPHWDQFVAYKLSTSRSSEASVAPPPADCEDCLKIKAHERRTPGLYKLEFSGLEFVGLNSKSYYVRGDGDKSKHSAKGCQKRSSLNLANYKRVLETGQSHRVENMGFRSGQGTVFTYKQTKLGLTPFYVKRKVLPDGITTEPLDL